MRYWIPVMSGLVILATVFGASAADQPPKITLKGGGEPIVEVVGVLLQGTNLTCSFSPDLDQKMPVPAFSISDVPVESALRFILRSVHMSHEKEKGGYVIVADRPADPVRPLAASTADRTQAGVTMPQQGMSKAQITTLLGRPPGKHVDSRGELWLYSDWIIRFRQDNVVELEPARVTRLQFKSSGKSVPYFEMLRRIEEARLAQAAARDAAAASQRDRAKAIARELALIQIYDPRPKTFDQVRSDGIAAGIIASQ